VFGGAFFVAASFHPFFKLVIAFHKPFGVLCQFTADIPGQRTLAEFGFPENVYPLGRLDMDSEGLLLLSDEAGLNDRLLNPRNAHPRTYLVQVEGIPDAPSICSLCDGSLVIRNHRCLPCKASIVTPRPDITPRNPPIRERREIPDTWIEIKLTEGKNRQVRRMTAAIGHPTLRLIRTSIGSLSDRNSKPGTWRELAGNEITRIWQ
jgi:23S rRNA pseudouridine2457 synthase